MRGETERGLFDNRPLPCPLLIGEGISKIVGNSLLPELLLSSPLTRGKKGDSLTRTFTIIPLNKGEKGGFSYPNFYFSLPL